MTTRLSRIVSLAIVLSTLALSLFFSWNGTPLPHAIAQDGTVETGH
jgi:hypothetical protein